MKKQNIIKRFNEAQEELNISDVRYRLIWYPVNGNVKPRENGQYLVTINKRDFGDERIVTIGSYDFSPFSQKYEWLHSNRMIAFAELPNPYDN